MQAALGNEKNMSEASSKMTWYVVNTYSGHENRARLGLLERVKNAGMEEVFGEVLIPTESVMEVVKGQRPGTELLIAARAVEKELL